MAIVNIKPLTPASLCNINPFIENNFDSLTQYQLLSKLSEKVNELISVFNDTVDTKIKDYIDVQFNNIMLNTMYDSESETLTLYLDNSKGCNVWQM